VRGGYNGGLLARQKLSSPQDTTKDRKKSRSPANPRKNMREINEFWKYFGKSQ
jgi:hypothetical protein